jgi:GTP-binding protein
MTGPLQLTFVASADDPATLPQSRREVAIVGRSNVGKSSLLNALANHKGLAHTSKTPGRTQLLNQFALPGGQTLVDLPGYGYAKAPAKERARWERRMWVYLLERRELVMVAVLVDGAVGPTALDAEFIAELRAEDVPFSVVATKHDKVSSSKRQRRRRDLAAGCGLEEKQVLWVSAAKGVNVPQLRTRVLGWLEV